MSTSSEAFAENMKKVRPIDGIGLMRLYVDNKLVGIIPNVPGKQNSLRIYANFTNNGTLSADGINAALAVFEPLINEALENPGKHPSIDLLVHAHHQGKTLNVTPFSTTSGLFVSLMSGEASQTQKREALTLLDCGVIRCAEKIHDINTGKGVWMPQLYAIDAMNAAFSAFDLQVMAGGFYDKVPLKTEEWEGKDFKEAGVRFIPGCFARVGAYIGKGTTLMPGSIVNVGAYIAGDGCMVDGGARVATGAQVGRGVKLGAGSGIEGILEPKGRLPSIIEDNVKIGANCEVAGIVEEGALIASGVVMASGKKIFDLRTNEEVEPRYMDVNGQRMAIPYIPAGRIAISGTYLRSGTQFGVGCILLLEKDAKDAALADVPKNAQLYIK